MKKQSFILKDFLLNDEGRYSITKPHESKQIAGIISKSVKNLELKVLTDGTACMGGDCIRLSKYFKHVNAFEINKNNYDLLVKNCINFDVNNIKLHNSDYLEYYEKIKQDVIYLDPQWDGPGYKLKEKVCLKIGDKDLFNILQLIKEKKLAKHVFIKAPFNVQLKDIQYSEIHVIFNKLKNPSFFLIECNMDT